MVNVKEWKKKHSQWWSADDVVVGDKFVIVTSLREDNSLDRPYLVAKLRLLRTGDEKDYRFGPKQLDRVAEALGNDDSAWIGETIEVVSIESYGGLGARGMIFRGVLPQPRQATLPPQGPVTQPPAVQQERTGPSTEALRLIQESKDLIDLGIPMNREDFNAIPASLRVELVKLNLVIEKEGLFFFTESAKQHLKS